MEKKQEFKMPYLGVDAGPDFDLLYGLQGEFSVLLSIENPVEQFSAEARSYESFHQVLTNIIKILGDEHYLQKLDVISTTPFQAKPSGDYLKSKFNLHFSGRKQRKLQTILVVTKKVKRNAFYTFDKAALHEFKRSVAKVYDVLFSAGMNPVLLHEKEINEIGRAHV